MTYYKKRVDENQKTHISYIYCSWSFCLNLSTVGQGAQTFRLAIKEKQYLSKLNVLNKAQFTEPQIKFMQNWRGGPVSRIDSVDAAIRLIKMLDMD